MFDKLMAAAEAVIDKMQAAIAAERHDIAHTYSVILERIHAIAKEL